MTFADVDARNPHVWVLFERFTLSLIRRHFTRYSADAVLHRVRWETAVALEDEGSFKINNNWSAYYARKFCAEHPEHVDFFELRVSQADQVMPPPPSGQTSLFEIGL
jgi:hypothetical protein